MYFSGGYFERSGKEGTGVIVYLWSMDRPFGLFTITPAFLRYARGCIPSSQLYLRALSFP